MMPRLQRLLTHSLAMRFFPNFIHADELRKIGIAFDHNPAFVTTMSQPFVQHDAEVHGTPDRLEELAFFGSLYLAVTEGRRRQQSMNEPPVSALHGLDWLLLTLRPWRRDDDCAPSIACVAA
jgi:hypothetical protein